MPDTHIYYIRTVAVLQGAHFQPPRTPTSVRKSVTGTLCILAFAPGTQPAGWADGMTAEQCRQTVIAASAKGVWWV